jgi:heterodisulfide reductase subunit C
MTPVNTHFIESIDRRFNAAACMNCGVCTALCPMEIELLPRVLFRQVMLGMEERIVANTDAIFSCLLCKMCEINCPAGVPIAENVRLLRNRINATVFGLGR